MDVRGPETDEGGAPVLRIEVASRGEASGILSSQEARADVTCLVSIGEAHDALPSGFDAIALRLRLQFADVIEGPDCPTRADVERIVELAERLRVELLRTTSGRVLVHCEAGVSRSAAAALIMYAVWLGPGREQEALERVLAQRAIARPNRLMVAMADQLLGRRGSLSAVVEGIE